MLERDTPPPPPPSHDVQHCHLLTVARDGVGVGGGRLGPSSERQLVTPHKDGDATTHHDLVTGP